jgi:integration host factor subunit alpha
LTNFSRRDKFREREGEIVMADRTVTRAQLTEAVYQEVGLSRNESAELVESVIAEISHALERGEMVKISSFGSFAVRRKGQRVGRNPKTGQEVPISPRRVLVFRASHALKHQINDGINHPGQPGPGASVAAPAPARSSGAKA